MKEAGASCKKERKNLQNLFPLVMDQKSFQSSLEYQYDCDGKPIVRLPKDSPVRSALHDIVQKLGL